MKKVKTLRQQLIPALFLAALLPFTFFTVISQIRLRSDIRNRLEEQMSSDLEKSSQCLDLAIEKYSAILYDCCFNDTVVETVRQIDGEEDMPDMSGGKLTRELGDTCNRDDGVLGITILTAKQNVVFYDSLSTSSVDTVWADKVLVPFMSREEIYQAATGPIAYRGEKYYTMQIARNIVDESDGGKMLGTVVLTLDERAIRTSMKYGEDRDIYLCKDSRIISATNAESVGQGISTISRRDVRVRSLVNQKTGWTIYGFHPLSSYRQTVREQFLLWVIIGIATIAALIGLIYYSTRPVLRSLYTLAEQMELVETGNLSVRIPMQENQAKEIQQIYSGFNKMVEQINGLIERVRQAVTDQKNAELSALEAQIDPHFLYNTLDAINWKAIDNDQYEISEMVGALADILRYTVKNAGEETTIERELFWLKKYVMLQEIKLGKELHTEIDVQQELLECKIHKLLLQPFVENAVKHGIYDNVDKKETVFKILIERSDTRIHIRMEDNGNGVDEQTLKWLNDETVDTEEHLGIANVRKRLKLYYGEDAKVYFESRLGEGVIAHLHLPL